MKIYILFLSLSRYVSLHILLKLNFEFFGYKIRIIATYRGIRKVKFNKNMAGSIKHIVIIFSAIKLCIKILSDLKVLTL